MNLSIETECGKGGSRFRDLATKRRSRCAKGTAHTAPLGTDKWLKID